MTNEQVRDVRDLTRKAGISPTTTRVHKSHPLLGEIAPGERTFPGGYAPAGAIASSTTSGGRGRQSQGGNRSGRGGSPRTGSGQSGSGQGGSGQNGSGQSRRSGGGAPRPGGASSGRSTSGGRPARSGGGAVAFSTSSRSGRR